MKKLVLQIIYSHIIRFILKLIIGIKFDDTKFLLNEKQFVIVANHNSHLDTMTIMASVPKALVHKVYPVAAMDYFGRNKFQKFMSNYFLNTLLIPRRVSKESNPISMMNKALSEGASLLIFPEGSRGKPEEMQKLKKGIGVVLSTSPNTKYIPVYMSGMGRNMPKGDSLIVPHSAKVRFGQATSVVSQDPDEIIQQIEQSILNLKA